MKVSRGDVVMTRFPHASGNRGKKRPALVVQAEIYNNILSHVLVAEITTNLAPATHPAFVLIDISTIDGQKSGLSKNSLVSGLFIATIFQDRVERVIGQLSPELMERVDGCLKAALDL